MSFCEGVQVNDGDWIKLKPRWIKEAIVFAGVDDTPAVRKYFKQNHQVVWAERFNEDWDSPSTSELYFKFPMWIAQNHWDDGEWFITSDKVTLVRRGKCQCDWEHCRNHAKRSKGKKK